MGLGPYALFMAYLGYRWADDPKIQSHLGGPWWRLWIPKAESDAAMREGRYGPDDLFGVTRMFQFSRNRRALLRFGLVASPVGIVGFIVTGLLLGHFGYQAFIRPVGRRSKIQSHLGGPWWRFWIPKAESDAAMREGRYGPDDLFGVTRMFQFSRNRRALLRFGLVASPVGIVGFIVTGLLLEQ